MTAAPDPAVLPDRPLPEWPLFGWAVDVRPAMAQARAAGEAFALVTLIAAEGGSPRPVGTQMLIAPSVVSGFLSGGCVEADVAVHARACLADGEPRRLVYGDGGPYPDIRLLCGGWIELLVEAVPPEDAAIRVLLKAEQDRLAAWYVTDGRVRSAQALPAEQPRVKPELFHVKHSPTSRGADAESAVRGGPELFHVKHWFDPPPRLIVVGSDPTALAIASLGCGAGFETWLVRPKGPELGPPLPGVHYDRRSPAEALTGIGLDPWTAVAVATHDLETDEAALTTALPSSAGYVGVLGARRRLPERTARLRALGVSEEAVGRLHGPIGLDLGGKAPFEIAISVLAEIIASRNPTKTA